MGDFKNYWLFSGPTYLAFPNPNIGYITNGKKVNNIPVPIPFSKALANFMFFQKAVKVAVLAMTFNNQDLTQIHTEHTQNGFCINKKTIVSYINIKITFCCSFNKIMHIIHIQSDPCLFHLFHSSMTHPFIDGLFLPFTDTFSYFYDYYTHRFSFVKFTTVQIFLFFFVKYV